MNSLKSFAQCILTVLLSILLFSGCAPTFKVVKLGKDENAIIPTKIGIPYYLPEPYILVTKNMNTGGVQKTVQEVAQTGKYGETLTSKTTTTQDRSISLTLHSDIYTAKIIYLPNFNVPGP